MPRPPRPDDLFALRVPIEVALSPGGQQIVPSQTKVVARS